MMMSVVSRYVWLCTFVVFTQKFVYTNPNGSGGRLSLSDVTVITDDGSGPVVNDRDKYTEENYNLSFQYTFKDEARCVEVRYKDELVWKNDGTEYPKAVCVHLDQNQIYMELGRFLYAYEYDGRFWSLETKKLSDVEETGIKLLTGDENERREDPSMYEVTRGTVSLNYVMKRGSKCTEIKYKENTLWKHGEETNNKYPKRVHFNFFKKIALIDFRSFYLVFNYRQNGCKLVSRTDIDKVPTSLVTVVTLDRASGSQPKENDFGSYDIRKYDFVSEFVFNDMNPCVEFKYANKPVWRYADEPESGHAKSLCLHKDLGVAFLELDDSINIYKCDKDKCLQIRDFPLGGFTDSKLTLLTDDGDGATPNDPTAYDEKTFGFGSEYIFKKGHTCSEVKFDNQTVWTLATPESERKAPHKVFFHIYTKMIIIDFAEFYLVYQHNGSRCQLLSRDSLMGASEKDFTLLEGPSNVQLDKTKYDIIKYPYGYAFVCVFKDTSCTEIKFRGQQVWKQGAYDPSPKSLYVNWDMKMLLVESPMSLNVYMHINKSWVQIFKFPDEQPQQEHHDEGEEQQDEPEEHQESVNEHSDEETPPKSHHQSNYVNRRRRQNIRKQSPTPSRLPLSENSGDESSGNEQASLRGVEHVHKARPEPVEEKKESQKKQRAKANEILTDAMAIVLLLSILATMLVFLLVCLSLTIFFLLEKYRRNRQKTQTELSLMS